MCVGHICTFISLTHAYCIICACNLIHKFVSFFCPAVAYLLTNLLTRVREYLEVQTLKVIHHKQFSMNIWGVFHHCVACSCKLSSKTLFKLRICLLLGAAGAILKVICHIEFSMNLGFNGKSARALFARLPARYMTKHVLTSTSRTSFQTYSVFASFNSYIAMTSFSFQTFLFLLHFHRNI